jgi:hypothetical protein
VTFGRICVGQSSRPPICARTSSMSCCTWKRCVSYAVPYRAYAWWVLCC